MFYHKKIKNKKCDNINIGTKELFAEYQKEKRTYCSSLFHSKYNLHSKRKKQIKIPISVFKKIILTYLNIYFFQLYLETKSRYFFLGGLMKVTLYDKITSYKEDGKTKIKKIKQTSGSIALYWYLRPSMRTFYMVDIHKLTGSTNRIPKIELIHSKTVNKDLLPIFIDELRKDKRNKTQYLCTLH